MRLIDTILLSILFGLTLAIICSCSTEEPKPLDDPWAGCTYNSKLELVCPDVVK